MRRAIVALAAVVVGGAGCGGQANSSGGGAINNPVVVDQQNERVRLCGAAATLHAASCEPFGGIDSRTLDDCSVVDGMYLAGYAICVTDPTCPIVQACVAKVDAGSGAAYDGPVGACGDATPTVPAGFGAAELAASYGLGKAKLADAPSSRQQPIEVCGTPAQVDYLMSATCADGSHPFADRAAARAAASRVGAGGRCGRVIDHVVAPCPEHPYDVFVDAYRCPHRRG